MPTTTQPFTIIMVDGRKFRRTCSEGEATVTFEGLTGASYLLDSVGNLIAGDARAYYRTCGWRLA